MYIYIYSYVRILNYPKMSQAEKQRKNQNFFSLVTRKSVQNVKAIFKVSRDKGNCIMSKNRP